MTFPVRTAAESTSMTSLYLYGAARTDGLASVISVASGATTYSVTCAPYSVANDCFLGPGVTVVDGPSTAAIHLTRNNEYTLDLTCSVSDNTADCIETKAGLSALEPGTTTTTVSDINRKLTPVTITAGLELLSSSTSGPTPTATNGSSRKSWTAAVAVTCGVAVVAMTGL